MNQQYFKGISSMMAPGECVIFPATEGNIVSFLKMTRVAERAEIRTLDGWKFLTSLKDALIDICPDANFLDEKIRPFLRRVKEGKEKIPKLSVIKGEDVKDYKPPMTNMEMMSTKTRKRTNMTMMRITMKKRTNMMTRMKGLDEKGKLAEDGKRFHPKLKLYGPKRG